MNMFLKQIYTQGVTALIAAAANLSFETMGKLLQHPDIDVNVQSDVSSLTVLAYSIYGIEFYFNYVGNDAYSSSTLIQCCI